jgi:hypothetical protein
MKLAIPAVRLITCAFLLGTGVAASADVIDPFTASRGPFTVGPNEFLTPEQGLNFTSSVLGGLRILSIGVGDDAQSGSTTTVEVSGGTFRCTIDFPSLGNESNDGGCATIYDSGERSQFDLSGSTQFLIDVQSVEGDLQLSVSVFDTNGDSSWAPIDNVTTGQIIIPFDDMISVIGGGPDLANVDSIFVNVINMEGQEGTVIIGPITTDGAIREGSGDEIAAVEIPGTYYNALRDGEGCLLTLERDQITFVLTCYFYRNGEQFWVIGPGVLVNGRIVFEELIITEGAQYGDQFNPADVVRSVWGMGKMTWSDCNNADLTLVPVLPGYEPITLEFTRIVSTVCGGGGVPSDVAAWMGAFFDALRDGEGFHFGVESASVFVMTWYTYLNGKQVWMIGTGARDGSRVVFDEMIITHGADFGSEFNAADVVREVFGSITVDFSDCNNFTATVDTVLPEFHDLLLNMTKIVPGACP